MGQPKYLTQEQIDEFESSIQDDMLEMDFVEHTSEELAIRSNISQLIRRGHVIRD